MSLPLATLQRQSKTVWLQDRFSSLPSGRGPALAFSRADEAAAYLNFWTTEAGAVSALRYALYRCEHSPSVFALSDRQVIQALAARLAQGALLLTEAGIASGGGGWPVIPAAAAAVSGAAGAAAAAPISLNNLPATPIPPPPLLPLLEELQIEGAEVLPEIEQTLEQIDLTMGSIDLAGVSLEPAPSKVPLIETAMTDASSSVTKTLDDL
ncbi:MAG: hypothetical protein V4593_17190 [Pseudomonadota bacterium]